MLALIPALIFRDLGNIISIAGALGGSCLGYIGKYATCNNSYPDHLRE